MNVIGCDEFASVESTSMKLAFVEIPARSAKVANPALCAFVENPAIVATPAMFANVAIPEKSENVAKPALCASIASIEVDIVPVVKPVIITSFPMNTESLNVDLLSTVSPSSTVFPSTFKS